MYVILFISPRPNSIPDLINYTDKPSSRLQLPAVQQSLFKLQWREEVELVGTRPLHTQTQSDVRRLLIRTAPFSTSEGSLSVFSLKPAHTCSPPPLSSSSFTHMHSLSLLMHAPPLLCSLQTKITLYLFCLFVSYTCTVQLSHSLLFLSPPSFPISLPLSDTHPPPPCVSAK